MPKPFSTSTVKTGEKTPLFPDDPQFFAVAGRAHDKVATFVGETEWLRDLRAAAARIDQRKARARHARAQQPRLGLAETEIGPAAPVDLAFIRGAPFWLPFLVRELTDSMDDEDERADYIDMLRQRLSGDIDFVRSEWRFALSRFTGPRCGLAAPVAELTGRASPYAKACQNVIAALSAALGTSGSDRRELGVLEAVEGLKRTAPFEDQRLLLSGAPISFFAAWAAAAWRERRRRALGADNLREAWSDARDAARADLMAALSAD